MKKSELEKIKDEKAEVFVKEYAKETHPNFYYSPLNCFLMGFNHASELLMKEIESLQAKLKVAEGALEFYGNKSSYTQISPDFGYSIVKLNADDYIEGWNDKIGYTTKTGGKRAREALAELRK